MKQTLKLGTRRSLLAWAQSSWVAREIERLNPETQVELVGIDTRGDQNQASNIPLHQLKDQGKEFFVAELDTALREKNVDVTVHSLKDLSLDRPKEFVLGAIPRRENPRDAILFGPRTMDRLKRGKTLRIGTSSPRRVENIPTFLQSALPGGQAKVEFIEIRGNVNTRLARVQEAEDSPRYLDGVVLAFAGLIRLWADEKARTEMRALLNGVRWMILPLRECPAAPGQGALAVECRADDARVRQALSRLHDATAADHVALEREVLATSGGGCHQRFGATAFAASPGLSRLMYVRGKWPNGAMVDELRWEAPAAVAKGGAASARAWDGTEWRRRGDVSEAGGTLTSEATPWSSAAGEAVFVAHSRAADVFGDPGARIGRARVWTSGTPSWFRLARAGVWVEGCAEGLGYDFVEPTLHEPVLQLPTRWTVLTHTSATGWDSEKRVIATYEVSEEAYDDEARAALKSATHVYWSSASQFDQLSHLASRDAVHACGPGKTARHLSTKGVRHDVFPSSDDWRKWVSG